MCQDLGKPQGRTCRTCRAVLVLLPLVPALALVRGERVQRFCVSFVLGVTTRAFQGCQHRTPKQILFRVFSSQNVLHAARNFRKRGPRAVEPVREDVLFVATGVVVRGGFVVCERVFSQ